MQWDSSCIIITFQPALLCQKVKKLQQLGVSMIGHIASFVHNNGNVLLLLLLFVIRPVLQLPHTTANQWCHGERLAVFLGSHLWNYFIYE